MALASLPQGWATEPQTAPTTRFTWPLEIDDGLSSTFGEYRSNHLHGGIDLRTRKDSGFAVYAAADGEIFRLKSEYRGYGKALYLQHDGGWITVYAHLERFENETLHLEDMLQSVKSRLGTAYQGNHYLDVPIRVTRGQIIAYSGESGAGLPHLHFETRLGEFEQVNPFTAGLSWKRDPSAPVIDSLTIVPEGPAARAGPDRLPLTVPFTRVNGSYVWVKPVIVEPPFRLLVTAFDTEGKGDNSCHVHSLKVLLDGREIHSSTFDRFSLSPALRVGLIFDLNRNGKYPMAFTYNLDPRATAYLPFSASGMPVDALAPGLHSIEVLAGDVWGNISRASGQLVVPSRAQMAFGAPRESAGGVIEVPVTMTPASDATARRLIEVSHDDGATFAPVPLTTSSPSGLITARIQPGNPVLSRRILLRGRVQGDSTVGPVSVAEVDALSFRASPIEDVAVDAEGRLTLRFRTPAPFSIRAVGFAPFAVAPGIDIPEGGREVTFDLPDLPSSRVYAQIELAGSADGASYLLPWRVPVPAWTWRLLPGKTYGGIRLTLPGADTQWDGRGEMREASGVSRPLIFERTDERTFTAMFDAPVASGRATVTARDGITIPIDIRRVSPLGAQRFVEGDLLVSFDAGAVYSEFLLWITRDDPKPDALLPLVGTAYRLFPEGEPMNRSIRVQMRYPASVADPARLGLYSWDPDGFWVYEYTQLDRQHRIATTSVMRLGRYALLQDLAPPEIQFVTPRPGSSVAAADLKSVLVEITDYGKGVDDSSIHLTIDGHPMSSYWDPDRRWAAHVFTSRLKNGRHTIRATARDHAGNAARPVSTTFYVR